MYHAIAQLWSGCRHGLRSAGTALAGHRAYRRFALIGHARTGSNFLLEGLATSRHIHTFSEIFAGHNRTIGEQFEPLLAQLYRRQPRWIQAVGCKIFYYHLTDEEWEAFLSHDEFLLIHLVRRNRLRTIVSLDIAFKTDVWQRSHHASAGGLPETIALDTAKLIKRIERIEQAEETARRRFGSRPFLEIAYEELASGPEKTFAEAGAFLGIGDINPAGITLGRQNPSPLRDIIENYAAVEELLGGTRFQAYLEE